MQKAIVFGNRELVERLELNSVEVINEVKNVSPLGDASFYYKEKLWDEAQVLILDLSVCSSVILRAGNKICTFRGNVAFEEAYDPTVYKSSILEKRFGIFIDLVKKHFEEKNVILIHAGKLAEYYVTGNQLRPISKVNGIERIKNEIAFIHEMENVFLQNVEAVEVSLLDYYFWSKIPGNEVDINIYEKEAYIDLNRWIEGYCKNGEVRNTPSFDIVLERYISLTKKTIFLDGVSRFMNREYLIDAFILDSPIEYVQDEFANYLLLKKILQDMFLSYALDEAFSLKLMNLIFDKQELDLEFKTVFLGYLSISVSTTNGNYEFYKAMFKKSIVPEKIMQGIIEWAPKWNVNANLITKQNAGYYFAMFNGFDEKECLKYVREKAILQPVLVDIYGSLVSAEILNENVVRQNGIVANRKYMHLPIFEGSKDPIQTPKFKFPEEDACWEDKLVRIQFEHRIKEELASSDAEWCLIDLYSLISPQVYSYKGFLFTDMNNKLAKKLKAKKIKPWMDLPFEEYTETIIGERLDEWCDWIKKKYGNKVIVVNFSVSKYKIGDDGRIYSAYGQGPKRDRIVKRIYEVLYENMQEWYFLDYAKEFLPDDLGYSAPSSVNYEYTFYEECFKSIKEIIQKRPQKKKWDCYSSEKKLQRMVQLRKCNESKVLIPFFGKEIDKYILQLSTENMEKYKSDLIGFYERKLPSYVELMKDVEELYESDRAYYEELYNELMYMDAPSDVDLKKLALDGYTLPYRAKVLNRVSKKLKKNIHYQLEYYKGEELLGVQEAIVGVKTKLWQEPEKRRTPFRGWMIVRESDGFVAAVDEQKKIGMVPAEKIGDNCRTYCYKEGMELTKLTDVEGDVIRLYAKWMPKRRR